jgi:phosphonate transport system substrate-binding protein
MCSLRSLFFVCVLSLLAGAGCASSGCSARTPSVPAPAEVHREVTAPPEEAGLSMDVSFDFAGPPTALVTVGLARPVGAQAAIAAAKKLNAYLEGELGGTVTTRLYADSAAIGDALASNAIDVAWLTPSAYVAARERSEIVPVLRLSRGGFTAYRSVFFAKAGAKEKNITDFKGKKMAWGAKDSSSSRLVPWAFLKRRNIDPLKFFKGNLDLNDHAAVCDAVANGEADLGVTLSDERPAEEAPRVDGCEAAGRDPAGYKIIERAGPIPNDVIAVRAGLDASRVQRLVDSFSKMPSTPEGLAQLRAIFNADAFGPVTDEDFAAFRTLKSFNEKILQGK